MIIYISLNPTSIFILYSTSIICLLTLFISCSTQWSFHDSIPRLVYWVNLKVCNEFSWSCKRSSYAYTVGFSNWEWLLSCLVRTKMLLISIFIQWWRDFRHSLEYGLYSSPPPRLYFSGKSADSFSKQWRVQSSPRSGWTSTQQWTQTECE